MNSGKYRGFEKKVLPRINSIFFVPLMLVFVQIRGYLTNVNWGNFVILALFLSGCAINYPALPDGCGPSRELAFIYKTDQKDRKRVMLKLLTNYERAMNDPKVITVSNRDSLRLSRVLALYSKGLVASDEDKFYAASVYDHGGGPKMHPDSTYFHVAYNLFKQLYEKGYKKGQTKSLMDTSFERWQHELNQK